MLKRIVIVAVMLMMLLQGVAAAAASGQVILEDTLYGAAIGGVLGVAWYMLDDDDAAKKVTTGLALGAIAGFVLGVTDVTSVATIENGDVKVGMPAIQIEPRENDVVYRTNLLTYKY